MRPFYHSAVANVSLEMDSGGVRLPRKKFAHLPDRKFAARNRVRVVAGSRSRL